MCVAWPKSRERGRGGGHLGEHGVSSLALARVLAACHRRDVWGPWGIVCPRRRFGSQEVTALPLIDASRLFSVHISGAAVCSWRHWKVVFRAHGIMCLSS